MELSFKSQIPWMGCLDPNFIDGNHHFEIKNGRNNMVIENSWFKKFKGTWHVSMIKEEYGQ
jgi:hypothetical protein